MQQTIIGGILFINICSIYMEKYKTKFLKIFEKLLAIFLIVLYDIWVRKIENNTVLEGEAK